MWFKRMPLEEWFDTYQYTILYDIGESAIKYKTFGHEETLRELVNIAESHDVYLMFDETYRELTFDRPLPCAATLSPKVVSISSMSKSFGLPGIRIGWLAARDRFIFDSVLAIREHLSITNSVVGEEIAVRVLEKSEQYVKNARDHALRNFKLVKKWMENQDKIEWIPPDAGVVSLPRIKKEVKIDPEEIWRLLVEKYKTFIIPGRCFEMDNRFFRLGYGAGFDEVKTGLNNLKAAIDEITSR